jgi:hypothetical protein
MTLPIPETPSVARRIVDILTPRRLLSRMHGTFNNVILPAATSFGSLFALAGLPPTFPRSPVPLDSPARAYMPAPSIPDARDAHTAIKAMLRPARVKGRPFVPFTGDDLLRRRMEMVQMLLWLFVHPDPTQRLLWKAASLRTASCFEKSSSTAKRIRKWARNFIQSPDDLPLNLYGTGHVSMLENGDLASKLFRHLQSVGKYVKAEDIVWYLDDPHIQEKYGLKRTVSLATARRWMYLMDYRWKKTPTGE